MDARVDKTKSSDGDIEIVKNKIAKLKVNMGKYNKAYEADVLSLEELRECLKPIRNEIAGLESQIREIKNENSKVQAAPAPNKEEIERFAKQATKMLKDLSFESKRAIIRSTVEKIISTQKQLEVVGRIILKENYVEYKTERGYCQDTIRHEYPEASLKSIPFSFIIKLPPPLKRGVDYGFKKR
jgi:site-specific DNA recombinase